MIYVIGIVGIILYLINLVTAIRNKQEKNYRVNYIVYCAEMIIILIFLLIAHKAEEYRENYIQNLEEKVNIYERSYEEYCLEDSIKQSDVYE